MGTLHYGSPPVSFPIEDRTLAHVELVVVAKLRRNENFAFAIDDEQGGRSTIWVSTSAALRFEYGQVQHEINRQWLEELIDSANTTAGMRLLPEPERPHAPEPQAPAEG